MHGDKSGSGASAPLTAPFILLQQSKINKSICHCEGICGGGFGIGGWGGCAEREMTVK